MKHYLAKKMYKIHGFCFDPCTVEMEAGLRKAGLYEAYEKRMMQGNMKAFANDIEQWALEQVNTTNTIVTDCLLYTSPSPRDRQKSRMPSSA